MMGPLSSVRRRELGQAHAALHAGAMERIVCEVHGLDSLLEGLSARRGPAHT